MLRNVLVKNIFLEKKTRGTAFFRTQSSYENIIQASHEMMLEPSVARITTPEKVEGRSQDRKKCNNFRVRNLSGKGRDAGSWCSEKCIVLTREKSVACPCPHSLSLFRKVSLSKLIQRGVRNANSDLV